MNVNNLALISLALQDIDELHEIAKELDLSIIDEIKDIKLNLREKYSKELKDSYDFERI